MAQAGLRSEALGSESCTGDLRMADILELTVKDNVAIFQRQPTMIAVRPELSKSTDLLINFLRNSGQWA